MLVTALGLLLGGRADSGAVRTGARRARVEGVVVAEAVDGFAAARRGRRGRGGGRPGRARPQRLGRGALPGVRRAARRSPCRRSRRSPSRSSRCTGSPTSTACSPRGPSGRPSTGSAASEVAALRRRWAGLYADLAATERELDDVVAPAARARAGGRPAPLRARRGRGGRPAARRGRRARRGGVAARVRRHPARRRRAGARGALQRGGAPRRAGDPAEARRQLESVREHDAEAGELADRLAEATYLLSDLAADVASYAASRRDRPGAARGRLRAAGGADRADAQVRRDRRGGAGLGRARRGAAAGARRHGRRAGVAARAQRRAARRDGRGRRRADRRPHRGRGAAGRCDDRRARGPGDAARPGQRRRAAAGARGPARTRPSTRPTRAQRAPDPTDAVGSTALAAVRRAPARTRSSSCWPPTPAASRGRCARAPRAASSPG